MKIKESKTVCGTLMSPLCIGNCAYIRHEVGYTRTSTVVAIQSVSPGDIRFETRNTHYRLLPDPISLRADRRAVLSMAA